jgi:hypothetical protein
MTEQDKKTPCGNKGKLQNRINENTKTMYESRQDIKKPRYVKPGF